MPPDSGIGPEDDPALVAALIAVAPQALGGVVLKGGPGPERDAWLSTLSRLTDGRALARVPFDIGDDRLIGGLDLAATMAAGRAVLDRGLLAGADGGIVVVAMAERWTTAAMQRICAAIDTGCVRVEREGLSETLPASFGVVALDEGIEDDEFVPPTLTDRLAFTLYVTAFDPVDPDAPGFAPEDVAAARARLDRIGFGREAYARLCETALALGIPSLRAPQLAAVAARAHAALYGRERVTAEDLEAACRLCLLPRATQLPAPPEQTEQPPEEPPPKEAPEDLPSDNDTQNEDRSEPPEAPETERPDDAPADDDRSDSTPSPPDEDAMIEAAVAALPEGLLGLLEKRAGGRRAMRKADRGKAGIRAETRAQGRARGARAGDPKSGARLDVSATLRAAAPWQRIRREACRVAGDSPRPVVRVEDFRVRRYEQRTTTTIVFLVDASGSQAVNRLAEAKGAVESLLADCYVRRDRVALITFRRQSADLVLPPTRSLVAAKKRLSRMPGGGGTPMALGLDAGLELAQSLEKRGDHAQLVVITDGRANVTRAGEGNPERATEEAFNAARAIAESRLDVLLIDASPRPRPAARELASALNADYLPLPYAAAAGVSRAVRNTLASAA